MHVIASLIDKMFINSASSNFHWRTSLFLMQRKFMRCRKWDAYQISKIVAVSPQNSAEFDEFVCYTVNLLKF